MFSGFSTKTRTSVNGVPQCGPARTPPAPVCSALYDVMWFEYVLWSHTMLEWVMNIHYQTWIAQGHFTNIIHTPWKQWGMCDRRSRSHHWLSNQLIYFLFILHQLALPFLKYSYLKYFTLKIQGQGHGQGQNWWLHLRPSVQSIRSFFVLWQSDYFVKRYNKLYIWP